MLVAAARNNVHTRSSVAHAVRQVLDLLDPPLHVTVPRGSRVLVKVNMGCSGLRQPSQRLSTHPFVAEAIINALADCGAQIGFGDDIARAGRHYERIFVTTGMREVAQRTGAVLVDFVASGAREVRGGLLYPRRYLVTNAYFDADVVINAASFRSHVGIGISGAIKNMFGCVVGRRKALIHHLNPLDSEGFGRTIADIYRTIPAHLSFLDATSVVANAGGSLSIWPVGLILAGYDPVALDTVAAYATGYESLETWTTRWAARLGVGCDNIERIQIRGVDWDSFDRQKLEPPVAVKTNGLPLFARITNLANATVFRPRPVIDQAACTRCGYCAERCPVSAIRLDAGGGFRIDLGKCADCGCCLACDEEAVNLQFLGPARVLRSIARKLPEKIDLKEVNELDPVSRHQ